MTIRLEPPAALSDKVARRILFPFPMSKKNSRSCPALQRDITSKECGSDRQSRIPCPADCPWNPFALQNYDELQLIEKSSDAAASARLRKSMSATRIAAFSAQVQAARHDPLEMESVFRQEYFHRPGPDGLDFVSHWEKAGWAGLNNDERVYFAGHRQIAPLLVEYQGPSGGGKCHVINLTNPESPPLLCIDLSLSTKVPRFTPILLWQFPLPHYQRLFGVNLTLESIGPFTPLEAVQKIVQHLGGPADQTGLLSWLALHFTRFTKAWNACVEAQHNARFQCMDSTVYETSWDYTCDPGTLLMGCNAEPLLAATWLTAGEEKATDSLAAYDVHAPSDSLPNFQENLGAGIMGRLLINRGRIKGSVLGKEAQHVIQGIIESALAPNLGPVNISVYPGPPLGAAKPAHDPALVPPCFLETARPLIIRQFPHFPDDPETGESAIGLLGDHLTDAYRDFIKATPPELGGLTVQAAAVLPEHRSAVARIIKAHYHSIDLLLQQKGYAIDIDDLVTGLGFPELIHEQPFGLYPGKAQPGDAGEETGDGLDEDDYDDEFIGLPALIQQFQEIAGPFSEAEIQSFRQTSARPALSLDEITPIRNYLSSRNAKDLERIVKASRQHWDLLDETLLDYTDGCLSGVQDRYFYTEILELTYLLFPKGPPATPIEPRRLLYHLIGECRSYQSLTVLKMSGALLDWVKDTPQPELSAISAARIVNLAQDETIELSPGEALPLLPLLKAVLLELCHLPERAPW